MPLLLQITKDSFSQSQSICYIKMPNLIFVQYDLTETELLFAQSLQSICSVYVDTSRVIQLVTGFFNIQPDNRK